MEADWVSCLVDQIAISVWAFNIPLVPQEFLYFPWPLILWGFIRIIRNANEESLLPIPSNAKLNASLKEVPELCGINKTLTFYIRISCVIV